MRTFASRVVAFYRHLAPPTLEGLGIELLDPYRNPAVRRAANAFHRKFFADRSRRTYLLGINPGRFGAGTTGVPFTDPVSLESQCGIQNDFPKRRELSAVFIEALIDRLGGPRRFYRSFFITAVCPMGFTRNGINCNYYDDPRLLARVQPFIVETLQSQIAFGARRDVAMVLGTGRNFAFLSKLNAELRLFDELVPLEHPRFIMQYRRRQVGRYLQKYERALRISPSGPA